MFQSVPFKGLNIASAPKPAPTPRPSSRRPQKPAQVPAAPESLHTYRKPARSRRKSLSEPASGAERSPVWSSYWWSTRILPLTRGVLPFPRPRCCYGASATRFPARFSYFPEQFPPPPPFALWRRAHGATVYGLCRSKINAGFTLETKNVAFVSL